jgi:elongator complex protein 2
VSGIWIPETRLGEVSSLKGATTAQGSSGGFWGGVWAPAGDRVSSWGKTGGWRVWGDRGDGMWAQTAAVGGAIRAVREISWDPQGRYLLGVRYGSFCVWVMVVWIRRRGCLASGDGMGW